jgi:ribosomal protein L22
MTPDEPKRPRRRRKKDEDEAPEVVTPEVEADAEESEIPADDAPAEPMAEEAREPEDDDEDEDAEGDDEEEEEDEDEVEELQADAPAAKPRRRRPGARRAAEDKPEVAPKPAPTRRRREVPAGPPPVVRAQAKYVRSSSRKARLVCDHIRGKSVEEARAILAHTPRAIARDWSKLLESAVANAEHNHELVGEDLYVKAVHADEGPTIKRFRPRAMGRATKIRKRTSHLTILLTPKDNRK